MNYLSLEEIFNAFNKLRVLIIGDVMVDSYLWGKVDRISPEAPVPIVNVQKSEKRLGGAANVALNIQAMGATPLLCSVIGNDHDGDTFMELLEQNKLSAEAIVRSNARITTTKHRIIASMQHMLRIDSEDDSPIHAQEAAMLVEMAAKMIPQCDVVIFEDYDKGVLCRDAIQQIIAIANEHNVPTVVDPKKRNFMYYQGATLFKPNLKELREGLKLDFDSGNKQALEAAVELLKEKLQLSAALITLSERGMYLDFQEEQHLVPAHVRSIADVSGAGDTVVSIAALALALQLPPKMIVSLANLGGGLVCEHVGVVPITKSELLKEAITHDLLEQNAY
jgi:rfaE bifunctional protein kinase chain/domain